MPTTEHKQQQSAQKIDVKPLTAAAYRVYGAIFDRTTKRPMPQIIVEAFDKDFWREQPLGRCTTDQSGRYEIRFSRDDFTGPLILLGPAPMVRGTA